jgi:intein-encoded DNA endonuclease-like protein
MEKRRNGASPCSTTSKFIPKQKHQELQYRNNYHVHMIRKFSDSTDDRFNDSPVFEKFVNVELQETMIIAASGFFPQKG